MLVLALVAALVVISSHHRPTSVSTTIALPPGPVTTTSALTVDRGKVVFSDDFHDPGSGWVTTPSAVATFSYGDDDYMVSGSGSFYDQSYAPYSEPVTQVGISTTATQSVGAPVGAGFGVVCRQGSGQAEILYEFLLVNNTKWVILRHDGLPATATLTLKEGTAPGSPGATPNTVAGMCATQPDGQTTRLAMFVDGVAVADITDSAALPGGGWVAGIGIASIAATTSTVTATQFTERNLDL